MSSRRDTVLDDVSRVAASPVLLRAGAQNHRVILPPLPVKMLARILMLSCVIALLHGKFSADRAWLRPHK